MISHKHKCIFVHIPKVAGISMEQVFLNELGLDYYNRSALLLGINNNKSIGPPRLSHLTAQEYVDLHYISKELFKEYFKFSFVRDPYDRVYSFYKYWGYKNIISFQEFICRYLPKIFKDKGSYYFVQPMYNYLYSEDGELLVDFIGRFENIADDFNKVLERVRFTGTKLPHSNASESANFNSNLDKSYKLLRKYPEILFSINLDSGAKEKKITDNMKEVVRNLYEIDFTYFNYPI